MFGGEKPIAELLLEIAMQIEIRATRVDHDFAGVVVQKKRDVHALGRDLHPLLVFAALLPLPRHSAVVVARTLGDGRKHGVRSSGEAVDFDHTERCAANLRDWRIEDQMTPLQKQESFVENVQSGEDSDDAPGRRPGVRRSEKQD